jgi:transcriptional regulator with XRE-family HTH domain
LATIDDVRAALGRNVRALRIQRGLTLDQLAARSKISRGMIVEIEQSRTNASIATLCQLAEALQTSVPALVELQEQNHVRIVARDEAAILWNGSHGGSGILLLGSEGPHPVEFWEWEMKKGDLYEAPAHLTGTREMLLVLMGTLRLTVDTVSYKIATGESVLFRADRPHEYANAGTAVLRFVMVVLQPDM